MKKTKIVFMGTPDFAVPVLEGLIEHYDVVMVVSQPDKLVGRKQILTPTPVKEVALKHQIPVFQPTKIREDFEPIKVLEPDLIITCAYGQIISEELLNVPKIGCFNVHASLLPKYRGGSPIHTCLLNGDKKTGVTIMYMDKGMDTGDMVSKVEYQIQDDDNVGTLHGKLSQMGATLLLETLPSIISKTNNRVPQDNSEATYAYNIKREEEKIDFHNNGKKIINQIRGLNPWPMAYFLVNNEEWKALEGYFEPKENTIPGKVSNIKKDAIGIECADGIIYFTKVKPFGKKQMFVKDYLNGTKKEDIVTYQIN